MSQKYRQGYKNMEGPGLPQGHAWKPMRNYSAILTIKERILRNSPFEFTLHHARDKILSCDNMLDDLLIYREGPSMFSPQSK